ncbi:glycosyltransferase family 4 protein [Desulfosporosinus sp. SYSU MS00001]|uniref:glycosyltransferase family 4 protein n=1 Tax=Desulfosporosinus sp. SYSU MS00001 TaxID=3416284 RepID=UPI003CE8B42C
MKIAIITETFLPSTDGVVTRLCATIQWLQKNGHEVLIIAPDLGTRKFENAMIRGVPAHTLFFYRDRKFSLPTLSVKKYLQEFSPNVVHVVNPALLGLSGVYYCRRLGLPLVASYHTNIPQYANYYHLPFLLPLLWQYFRALHNQADINLCTSEAVRHELASRGFKNLYVWKRGVEIHQFSPQNYDQEMREFLTKGQARKTLLLYVGRLATEKGIEKIRTILESSSDFCLALVGDGPHRERLQDYFKESQCLFTGFLHGKELAKAYASADIFVFPSITETLGLVILEAMASGLPIVAARTGPSSEQIADGINGLLYSPDDPQSLLDAVSKLKEKSLHQEIANNAYKEASKLAWDKSSQQLLEFYKQACKETESKAPGT